MPRKNLPVNKKPSSIEEALLKLLLDDDVRIAIEKKDQQLFLEARDALYVEGTPATCLRLKRETDAFERAFARAEELFQGEEFPPPAIPHATLVDRGIFESETTPSGGHFVTDCRGQRWLWSDTKQLWIHQKP